MAKRKKHEDHAPRSQVKKQKVEESSSVSADENPRSGSAGDATPPTQVSGPGANRPKKLRVKKPVSRPTTKADPDPIQKVIPISKVLRSKVLRVLNFNNEKLPGTISALERDGGNAHHAVVTESAAIAALMRMRNDYQISDPTLASLEDISEVLVNSFTERIGGNLSVRHIVLDLSKRSLFEASIHLKLEQSGVILSEINLLEAELEMLGQDLETAVANDLLCHVQTVYDESDSSAEVSLAYEESSGEGGDRAILLDETKEIARAGICPAPLMEI